MDVKAHIQQALSKALGREVHLAGDIISPEGQPHIDDMPEEVQRIVAAQIIEAALPQLKAGTDYSGEGAGILVGNIGHDHVDIQNVDGMSIEFALDFMRARQLVLQIGRSEDEVPSEEVLEELSKLAISLLPILIQSTEKAARDKRELDMLRPVVKLAAKVLLAIGEEVRSDKSVVDKMLIIKDVMMHVPEKSLKMMLDKYKIIDQNDNRG